MREIVEKLENLMGCRCEVVELVENGRKASYVYCDNIVLHVDDLNNKFIFTLSELSDSLFKDLKKFAEKENIVFVG